jgi:type IV pilus assembly protein PilE
MAVGEPFVCKNTPLVGNSLPTPCKRPIIHSHTGKGLVMKRWSHGFSLVELLVVIAIIGVISAIALPSYQEYLRRGYRSDAQQFMLTVANKQEAYLLDNRAYTATVGSGGLGLTAPTELSGKYGFAICTDPGDTSCATAGTASPYFKVTATAAGVQLADGDLTLTSAGAKTKAGVSGW